MSECVLFAGKSRRRGGYGSITRDKRGYLAHRLVYEDVHGAIPVGHDVHHTCEQPLCLNPEHLVLVPHREHRRRFHRQRTHCPRGHLIAGDNAYVYRDRTPDCRICRSEAGRRRKEKAL